MSPHKREAAERAMQNIGGQAGQKLIHDQREWARKILNDQRKRSPEVVRMAQRALGEDA